MLSVGGGESKFYNQNSQNFVQNLHIKNECELKLPLLLLSLVIIPPLTTTMATTTTTEKEENILNVSSSFRM